MTITLNFKDLAYGLVLTAPSPANSGGSLTLQEGQGDDFPDAPFDVTMFPPDTNPTPTNAEIGLCTEKDGDILHITRAQRGTTAKNVGDGWQVMNCIDAELLNEIIALTSGADGDILDQVIVSSFDTGCGPSDAVEVNGVDIAPICSPDGDGTNPFQVTFVAPASGKVELWAEMEIFIEMFNLPSGLAWCFADGETGTTPVSPIQEVNGFSNVFGDAEINTYTRAVYHAFVDGLTPGDTYNWQLSGYTLPGSAATDIVVNTGTDPDEDPWGPAVITVQGGGSGGGGGDDGGSGLESVVAGDGIEVDDTDPLNPIISATGGGGGGDTTIQAAIHQATTINFDDANILTGIDVYDVEEGDIVLDIWVEILTNWDGTTPFMDVGTFDETSVGFFAGSSPGSIDATNEDSTTNGYRWRSWGVPPHGADLAANNNAYLAADGNQSRVAPFTITDGGHPIQVIVTQDGTSGGADPGSTQGQAIVHVLVVPAAGVTVGGGGGGDVATGFLPPVVVASNDSGDMVNSPPSGPATIDSSTVEDDWRVLLTNQTVPQDNGIWIVNTGGDWVRPDDFPTGVAIPDGLMVSVGEVNGSWNWASVWMFQGAGVIVDTDPNYWAMIASNAVMQWQQNPGGAPYLQLTTALNMLGMLIIDGQLEIQGSVYSGDGGISTQPPVTILEDGATAMTLPTASSTGDQVVIIKNDSVSDITITPDGTAPDTIDENSTFILYASAAVFLRSDGETNWDIIALYPGNELDIGVVRVSEIVASSAFFNGSANFNSNIDLNSGIAMQIDVINTSGATIGAAEEPLYILQSGAVDPTLLPASTIFGNTFWVKNVSGGSITINPDPTNPDTIEGASTLVLIDGASVQLWSDGANNNWLILASHGL